MLYYNKGSIVELDVMISAVRFFLIFLRSLVYFFISTLSIFTLFGRSQKVFDISSFDHSFLILVVVGSMVASILLSLNDYKIKILKSIILPIERRLINLCVSSRYSYVQGWRCWIVPVIYKLPIIKNESQTKAIDKMISLSLSDERSNFFIISGESGSGKTRSIGITIKEIKKASILDKKNSPLFFYSDLSGCKSKYDIEYFLNSRSDYCSILFLDNFHLADGEIISYITDITLSGKFPLKLLVILSQPKEMWRVNPEEGVKIISKAKENQSYIEIHRITENDVKIFADSYRINDILDIRKTFGGRKESVLSDIVIISSLWTRPTRRVYAAVKQLTNIMRQDYFQLNSHDNKSIALLAVVVALSIHRGSFSYKDFNRIVWRVFSDRSLILRVHIFMYAKSWIKQMKKSGILPSLYSYNRQCLLNESLAEEWKDFFYTNEVSKKIFIKYFRKCALEQYKLIKMTPDVELLLSIESEDESRSESLIESAPVYTNINRIIYCLERNKAVMNSSEILRLNYFMLLNKSGCFKDAKVSLEQFNPSIEFESTYRSKVGFAKIEAEHGNTAIKLVNQFKKSKDKKTRLTANYWDLHMKAHKGIFNPEGLKKLLDSFFDDFINGNKSYTYDDVYLLSRLVFDGCRHLYLKGIQESAGFKGYLLHDACEILTKVDSQYKPALELYARAHWVNYIYLFTSKFFPERLSGISVPNFVNISPLELKARHEVLSIDFLARDLYVSAKGMYQAVGGREAKFLEADIINMNIICADLNDSNLMEVIRCNIAKYRAFLETSGFEDLYSYSEFYELKLSTLIYLNNESKDDNGILLKSSQYSCSKLMRFDKKYGNQYGIWRGRFFRYCILYIHSKITYEYFLKRLDYLEKLSFKYQYHRDGEIVLWVKDSLKSGRPWMETLFKYYPFVHQ